MTRVLVTGGTGFLGGRIVERLVADGREVVALSRSDAGVRELEAMGVARAVKGSVLDRAALVEAVDGCEVVYHVAGDNRFCLADPGPMYGVNVEGSRRVVEAAAQAGARLLVYTSSAAALGERAGTVGSEESSHRGSYLSHYERSKHLAEQGVRATAEDAGLDVVYVLPSSVQGPGRAGGTGRLLLDFVNGRLRAIVDTQLSLVDIADCTEGHLLAEVHGTPGERYVLSGSTVTVSEGMRLLGEVTGADYPIRAVPGPLAHVAAVAFARAQRARGRQPKFCGEMIRTMRHGHAYDGSKASRDLGLRYTPLEGTLRRTVEWFVAQGMVTRELPRL